MLQFCPPFLQFSPPHTGMAAMLKAADPSVWVVGCQPAASDVMRQSVAAGYIVDVPSGATLSDATAGETHKPYTNPDPRLGYSGP